MLELEEIAVPFEDASLERMELYLDWVLRGQDAVFER